MILQKHGQKTSNQKTELCIFLKTPRKNQTCAFSAVLKREEKSNRCDQEDAAEQKRYNQCMPGSLIHAQHGLNSVFPMHLYHLGMSIIPGCFCFKDHVLPFTAACCLHNILVLYIVVFRSDGGNSLLTIWKQVVQLQRCTM